MYRILHILNFRREGQKKREFVDSKLKRLEEFRVETKSAKRDIVFLTKVPGLLEHPPNPSGV